MKQRLGIAAALLSDPQLLLLDEPANGLDPAGIVAMRETLRHLASAGKTVFVSSHLLAEVQQLADMIGIIAAGRLVREGTIADMLHDADLVRVRVAPDEVAAAAGRLKVLPGIDEVEVADAADGWITVRVPASRAAELNQALADGGIYAARLEAGSDLEDLFLALTADESASHEGTFRGISSARDERRTDR
jgi:ABC-2 type transport system ATP-binding protein